MNGCVFHVLYQYLEYQLILQKSRHKHVEILVLLESLVLYTLNEKGFSRLLIMVMSTQIVLNGGWRGTSSNYSRRTCSQYSIEDALRVSWQVLVQAKTQRFSLLGFLCVSPVFVYLRVWIPLKLEAHAFQEDNHPENPVVSRDSLEYKTCRQTWTKRDSTSKLDLVS